MDTCSRVETHFISVMFFCVEIHWFQKFSISANSCLSKRTQLWKHLFSTHQQFHSSLHPTGFPSLFKHWMICSPGSKVAAKTAHTFFFKAFIQEIQWTSHFFPWKKWLTRKGHHIHPVKSSAIPSSTKEIQSLAQGGGPEGMCFHNFLLAAKNFTHESLQRNQRCGKFILKVCDSELKVVLICRT